MYYIEQNIEITDSFQVLDKHDNPVTGLLQSDFTIKLYNPSKNNVANISAGVTVTIEEVGDGFYRTSFTPDTLGAWNLIIINEDYIEAGIGEDYYCVESLGGGVTEEIENMIKRAVGLTQENYRIFNQTYDKYQNLISAKIKLYNNAIDCNNDENAFAEYEMSATWDNKRHLTGYKTVRTV